VPTDTDTLAAQAEAEAQSMSLDDLRAHYAWNTAISERDEALARVAELEAQLVAARAAGRLSPTCRRCWRTRRATMKTEIPHVDPKTTTGLGWWWKGFAENDRRFIINALPQRRRTAPCTRRSCARTKGATSTSGAACLDGTPDETR
jgi:hypothetical protein